MNSVIKNQQDDKTKNMSLKDSILKKIHNHKSTQAFEKKKKQLEDSYQNGNHDIEKAGFNKLVSIIVTDEKSADALKTANFYKNYEVIVAGGNTNDNQIHKNSTTDLGSEHNDIEGVHLTALLNKAAASAKGEYLVFLNNCVKVSDGWLDGLLSAAAMDEKVGTAGSLIVDSESKLIRSYGIRLSKIDGKKTFLLKYKKRSSKKQLDEISDNVKSVLINDLNGLLIKKELFEKVNGFDEAFFADFFDADLCMKLARLGYKNVVTQDSMLLAGGSEKNSSKLFDRYIFCGRWQRTVLKKEDIYAVLNIGNRESHDDGNIGNNESHVYGNAGKDESHVYGNAGKDESHADGNVGKDGSHVYGNAGKNGNRIDTSGDYDEKQIDILGSMPDNDTRKFWGDYHYSLALKKAFEKMGYKANVVCREHWYEKSSARYIIVLRGKYPYFKDINADKSQKLIAWVISHPENISATELSNYDYIFFASEIMKDKLAKNIDVPSDVLMQCTDPEVMTCGDKGQNSVGMSDTKFETGVNAKNKAIGKPEILFVGNSRGVYRRILKDLLPTNHELKVYGREWEEYPEVQKYVVSDYIDNNKVSSAYHDAGIVLNDHWDEMRENGLISNRIFDVLASGGFVISDDVPGIEEVFGGNVVTYKDSDDLKTKVDFYLTHAKERNAKAIAGHEIVVKKHTFYQRALRIAEEFDV